MNKNLLSILIATTALSTTSTVNAFNNGDVINFKPSELGCLVPTNTFPACSYGSVVISGSYFAMDTDGDGSFRDNEKIAISPGSDGGIVIGALQPATSHSFCPDGTEISPVDAPWCFFGNSGSHQVTGIPITDNGDGTLDFSGWGVTWNGISNIPMGQVVSNATLTCSSSPCTVNDVYEINLTSVVPANDPSNFGGVAYQLHLESNGPAIPTASINITITGGTIQQCSSRGGSTIQMNSTTIIPADDSVDNINWIVDGVTVATGDNVSSFIDLGSHNVTASVTTVNGLTAIQNVNVTVQDTTSPVITAAFIDKETGNVITEAATSDKVKLQVEATDVCDSSPIVSASIGAPVEDRQTIKIDAEKGKIKLHTSKLTLTATAVDASGNAAINGTSLIITD